MTQIKVILAIFGDLLIPETLSRILNLTPDAFWYKGDLIPNMKGLTQKETEKRFTRKETGWEYSIGFTETLDVEDLTNKIVELIDPNLDSLIKYISENNLETKLFIVVKIVNGESPSLYIDKKIMGVMLKINGEFDIDLYVIDGE